MIPVKRRCERRNPLECEKESPVVAVYQWVEHMPWPVKVAPEPESIGRALKRLRGERGLKEVHLATDIPLSTLSSYETDKYSPDIDNIKKLATYLDVDPETLFAIDDEHRRWQRMYERLPGPGIALPADPGMEELAHELILLKGGRLDKVTELVRTFRVQLNAQQDAQADEHEQSVG